MGFVFQDFNLVPVLTALENVMLACDYAGAGGSKGKSAALDALELVGLRDRADHRPSELSGGEQQRVAIARALVNRPSLVMADEPTGNLDSERSADVLGLLRRFNREQGQTFVLVTHDSEVGDACDRIVRMRDGKIREDGGVAGRAARPEAGPAAAGPAGPAGALAGGTMPAGTMPGLLADTTPVAGAPVEVPEATAPIEVPEVHTGPST